MKKALLGIILMLGATVATGQPSDSNDDLPLLNPDVPEQYQVVPGDTLWDISALFLCDPWMWPEIWHANQQIANPHLIYPGDIISLVYMDERPQLMLSRNREEKLSPHIRVEAHQSPIPALPLEAIDNFMSKTRVVSDNQLNLVETAADIVAELRGPLAGLADSLPPAPTADPSITLDKDENLLLDQLGFEPADRDSLSAYFSAEKLSQLLISLELKGVISHDNGNYQRLI
jgi:hypothetical protein